MATHGTTAASCRLRGSEPVADRMANRGTAGGMAQLRDAEADRIPGEATLRPAGAPPVTKQRKPGRRRPAAAIAARLVEPVSAAGRRGVLYLATSETAADEVARALKSLMPDAQVIVLPSWDCLPYDSALPSRECM